MFKSIPLLCTHIYSYMFSTMHPPRYQTDTGKYARSMQFYSLSLQKSLVFRSIIRVTTDDAMFVLFC